MITRFAPSPTGPLHLGHAWSAMIAHDMARAEGGSFLLRIEDIDRQRARPEWEAQLKDDLNWLGIVWDAEPMRQSDRMDAYGAALDDLWSRFLLYPCTCSRRDIAEALSAPQEGVEPTLGPDGPVYPGTCRADAPTGYPWPPRPEDVHLRIDMNVAQMACEHMILQDQADHWGLSFLETGPLHPGTVATSRDSYLRDIGDVVLARREFGTSYHLSVVVDDAAQGVTHVVRGGDLFEATPIHVLLQRLLGLPTPVYHHHDLVRDGAGKRLAKRDDARSIASYRDAGWSAEALLAHLRESRVAP
ncbi:tRNA glutamyl-Q(34) synthetase GluQRS [Jannaschia pohangensis]|uniref:Glutamyl-Q tRNA(Asp) synthetase n=1 Tax=Jannaschia pohangensis TaxID=390807 RepID=A0A1I3GJB5_9RHOB|nr:tRNA glutamyl-Q(34) synthetase GluQRS [Jannaschia pohangensis]SFI23332.1 glutamyl-Q tRNA(Asp) synthetase [Jannaschia pohangensis]